MMKKKILWASLILLASPSFLSAQIKADVSSIELNANGKSKTSKIVCSYYNPETGTAKLTFVKTLCEGTEIRGTGFKEFTAKEIVYNFEHMLFNKDYSFKAIETETINGLNYALVKYPVLGKDFQISSMYNYLSGANKQGGWANQYSFVVKTVPQIRDGFFYCNQLVVAQKESLQIPFQESVLYTHSVMDGVYIFTQNSQSETTVNVRYFDHEGKEKVSSSFKFDYGMCAKVNVLKNELGGTDFIFIAQPTAKYNKYGVKIDKIKSNPLEFEYIRIDGNSLAVKDRFTFNALSTQWYPENVIEQNGAVYVFGSAAEKVKLSEYHFGSIFTTEGMDFQNWLRLDELENYQYIKVKGGKLDYVKSLTPTQMSKAQSIVNGVKGGGNKPSGYFRLQEMKVVGDKVYLTGQNTSPGKVGDDRKNIFMMVLDEKGDLNKLWFVPKSNYSNSNMFVSPDNKSMIWAIYDYSEYDVEARKFLPVQVNVAGMVVGGSDHTIVGRRKLDDGPTLQAVQLNLETNTTTTLETFGKDEYTLYDECKVLHSNDTEVVFLGLAGKVKDRSAKIIRLKF